MSASIPCGRKWLWTYLQLVWNKMKLSTLIKLKINACKDSQFLCMHDYKPESFFYFFYITWSFTNPRRFEKQSILWHRFCSCGWPKTHVAFLMFFILHDNIQALCVAALSVEELGAVLKNNLKGFALGINFHTLFNFFLPAIRNFDASSVLPPVSATLHENIHKRVFMTYLRMSTHKESKVNIYACLLQCFEEGGFINC